MRHIHLACALLAAGALASCGGGGSQKFFDATRKPEFTALVSFGDSLADVGTYAVGRVLALGGGKYTINGDNTSINPALTGKNWSEVMAAQLDLPAPCPAETGLDGNAAAGFSVAVVQHAGCFSYAQGGARVTNPVGPSNKLTGSPIGQLTVPVSTQIANHLAASGGTFRGDEVVFVTAGANDAIMQLGQLSAAATAAGLAAASAAGAQTYASALTTLLAAGATDPATAAVAIAAAIQAESVQVGHTTATITAAAVAAAAAQPGNSAVASPAVYGPMVNQAQAAATTAGQAAGAQAGADYAAANAPAAVAAMATAGTQLAGLVTTQIVAKGANYVVVNNTPDLAGTPNALLQPASTQALIKSMVSAFNDALKAGVAGEAKILYVDIYTVTHEHSTNPAPYGLTNTTTPACGPNPLGTTSLVCTAATLIPGDVSHYMFADDAHPTPFENLLIARYIAEQMAGKGWL